MTNRQKLLDPASPAASPDDGPRNPPAADRDTVTVTLDYPIRRGQGEITEITLRKPRVRALRGINLADLMQINTDAVAKLLPRITDPPLNDADIDRLDPADLTQLGTETASFFLARRFRGEETA